MLREAELQQVTRAVGDAIRRGEVEPDLGHLTIGGYAAWLVAREHALKVAIGGDVGNVTPSELYACAGEPNELRSYATVLTALGINPPWNCPDCAAQVGERHADGCDVGRCPACGRQALGCDQHLDSGTQAWTGRWPGEIEVEQGLARDLNDLAVKGATGDLAWSQEAQRYIRPV